MFSLPVSFQEKVRWQLKQLVVLYIQDLHLCVFKPVGQSPQLVMSHQQLPQATIAEQP